MSYTIEENKTFTVSANDTYDAVLKAINGLEGKLLKQDPQNHAVTVQFHKTILGKVLGDRTHMTVNIQPNGDGSQMAVTIYPLDAVGRKLMFGARKGVSRTVLTWFYAHVDHHLKAIA